MNTLVLDGKSLAGLNPSIKGFYTLQSIMMKHNIPLSGLQPYNIRWCLETNKKHFLGTFQKMLATAPNSPLTQLYTEHRNTEIINTAGTMKS